LVLQLARPPGARLLEAPSTPWTDPDWAWPGDASLIDTTMLFAPKSGGVKRYLLAKQAWFSENRPGVRHTLVVPGAETRRREIGLHTIAAVRLPFGDGYRCPASTRKWADQLEALSPDVIEAGDPYGPGHAALEAGERLGIPVVGFCHSDPAALAALHLGSWAEPPVRRRWARLISRFDRVVAPSRHIAERLFEAGVHDVVIQPLGVDVETFHPDRADRDGLRRELGLSPDAKLLVFAGRPAREKNIDVILEAAAKLGPDYHLLLVGAGAGARPQANAIFLPYRRDPSEVARIIASCDAFVHANHREPFGLVVLEAMACGLPVVGVESGGVSELVDEAVGQLAARAEAGPLAEAIETLFARDWREVGLAARRRAEERHAWNRTFEKLSALYGGLAGARPLMRPAARLGTDGRALTTAFSV
jgi:alpha-1,6-mannosyltransferase